MMRWWWIHSTPTTILKASIHAIGHADKPQQVLSVVAFSSSVSGGWPLVGMYSISVESLFPKSCYDTGHRSRLASHDIPNYFN